MILVNLLNLYFSFTLAAESIPRLHVEIVIGDKTSVYRMTETKPGAFELEFLNNFGTKSRAALSPENARYLLKLDKEITDKSHELSFCPRNYIKIIDDRGILIACGPSKTKLTQKASELVRLLAVIL